MNFFPLSRPKAGLSVTADRICMAGLHKGFGHGHPGDYGEQLLPGGSIALSPLHPNIRNREQVLNLLQDFCSPKKSPQSIALCLPDMCARTTVLELTTLPKKPKEQQALVEWRLQEELNLSKEKRRIAYQVLPSLFQGPSEADHTPTAIRLLATSIQEDIIDGYESLCLEAGLIPVAVQLASVAVFNLCRPLMESTLKTAGTTHPFAPGTLFFLYVADWGISVVGIYHHILLFLRTKPLRQISQWTSGAYSQSGDDSREASSLLQETASPFTPDIPKAPHKIAQLVTRELVGTLQYYFEANQHVEVSGGIHPLFIAGSPDPDRILPEIATLIEEEFPIEGDGKNFPVKAFPLYPGNPSITIKPLWNVSSWTGSALPAFAATS